MLGGISRGCVSLRPNVGREAWAMSSDCERGRRLGMSVQSFQTPCENGRANWTTTVDVNVIFTIRLIFLKAFFRMRREQYRCNDIKQAVSGE